MMYLVFFSTSDVFKAEELFKSKEVECSVVPTPVQDKANCGVCLEMDNSVDLSLIENLDYERIEG